MKNCIYILLFLIKISNLHGETSYPGLSIFTSSFDLSLGGSGFLFGSSISTKVNPAIKLKNNIISTSLVRYPAQITSENIGVEFPFINGGASLSILHVTYGTFQGYNEKAEKESRYTSQDLAIRGSFSNQLINFLSA